MLIASTSLEERQRLVDAELAGPGHERADVLGQAAAAEAESRRAGIGRRCARRSDSASASCGDVGAGGLADLGHRVDERDLRGQEGVGRDLHQLGGGEVGDDERRTGVEDRLRTPRASSPRPAVVSHAEHDPVRAQRVVDGEALAQELRVPGQLDRRAAADGLRQPATGRRAGGHGGLADDERARSQHRTAAIARRRRRRSGPRRTRPCVCGVPTQTKCTSPNSPTSS